MKTRKLGKKGPAVSAMGLGCMGMSQAYGSRDDAASVRTLHRALDLGLTLLDTADVYGEGHNETLVGQAIRGRRTGVFLATKCGITFGDGARGLDGSPVYIRSACHASLARLGVDVIDLYYLHRVDQATPIEESVGAMAALVREGKVRHLGLSEVSPGTLRRACAVHPIAAVQSEYSLWFRDPDTSIIPACRELSVGFVPFSPLGRGFLSGRLTGSQSFGESDMRRALPRFQGENFARNAKLADEIGAFARAKGITSSQLALAWVMAQGEDVIPIPGTKRIAYLEENLGALEVALSAEDISAIEDILARHPVSGERYNAEMMAWVDRG